MYVKKKNRKKKIKFHKETKAKTQECIFVLMMSNSLGGGGGGAQRGNATLSVVMLQFGRGRYRVGHLLHLVVGRLGFGFLLAERLLEGAAQLQCMKQRARVISLQVSDSIITWEGQGVTPCCFQAMARLYLRQRGRKQDCK